jgi:hypothetical protein
LQQHLQSTAAALLCSTHELAVIYKLKHSYIRKSIVMQHMYAFQVFKKPDPKELVRKWQADLRAEQRKMDRQIRGEEAAANCQCFQPKPP